MQELIKIIKNPFNLRFKNFDSKIEWEYEPIDELQNITLHKYDQYFELAQKKNKFLFEDDQFHQVLQILKQSYKNHVLKNNRKELLTTFKANKAPLQSFNKNQSTYTRVIEAVTTHQDERKIEKNFIKNEFLSNYSTILFLSLEKGSSHCHIFDYSSGQLNLKQTTSTLFNKIFNHIKKSKKNYFINNDIILNELELVGHSLAESFEVYNKNMVFIVSNSDLIPPMHQEIQSFQNFAINMKKHFNVNEKQTSVENSIQTYLDILTLLKYDINVQSPLHKVSNTDKKVSTQFIHTHNDLKFHYSHSYEFDQDQADVFQHYRIKLLGELFNILKHELSNPLQGIHLGLDIINEEFSETDFNEIIIETRNASQRSLDIFNTMTEVFSSQEKSKLFSLSYLLKTIKLTLKSELRHVHLSIQTEPQLSLDSTQINTSPSILNQILFNLIHNSIQELKPLDIEEKIIIIAFSQTDEKIIIDVIDNGKGIAEALQAQLFLPKKSTKSEGTGLGLAISFKLAKKIGAGLKLKKSDSNGTVFQLSLAKNQEAIA